MARLISRGDFWIVDLDRPGLIISKNKYHRSTYHVIVIPSTSIVPEEVSEEMVAIGTVKGFEKESVLLPLLIRSIDQERLIKKVGKISKQKLLEVEDALNLVLGMSDEI